MPRPHLPEVGKHFLSATQKFQNRAGYEIYDTVMCVLLQPAKNAALAANAKLKETNFSVKWKPALVPLLLSSPCLSGVVFARETKLEAINLGQTPLLWLQTHGAGSVGKEEQEVTDKGLISP